MSTDDFGGFNKYLERNFKNELIDFGQDLKHTHCHDWHSFQVHMFNMLHTIIELDAPEQQYPPAAVSD